MEEKTPSPTPNTQLPKNEPGANVDSVAKTEEDSHIEAILSNLQPEQRKALLRRMVAIEKSTFKGPLPRPEDFIKYDKARPGTTDKIINWVDKQVSHRIECEKTIINNNFDLARKGQLFGGILAILCIIGAVVLGLWGSAVVGSIMGGTTVLGVIIVFVLNKEPNSNNKDIKDNKR